MTNFITKNIWVIIGVIVGAAGGFLYWNFIGCSSGSCNITSVWYNSTGYGAVMGALLAGSIRPTKK